MYQGIPLVYHDQMLDEHIEMAVQFHHQMYGTGAHCLPSSSETLLIVQRGDKGLLIVNKTMSHAHIKQLVVPGKLFNRKVIIRNSIWKILGINV